MAQYVVSFDVDWDVDELATYSRTREAVAAAIEALPHCKILQTFYAVGYHGTAKDLCDHIRAAAAAHLRGQASAVINLSALVKGRGSFHSPGENQVVACMDALDVAFPP